MKVRIKHDLDDDTYYVEYKSWAGIWRRFRTASYGLDITFYSFDKAKLYITEMIITRQKLQDKKQKQRITVVYEETI